MNKQDVQYFKNWFYFYVKSFAVENPDFQRNYDLKEQHTRWVCREAVDIGRDLGLSESDLRIAEVTALFHDVGRFEQLRRFNTFSDRRSVDHAAFGVEILEKNQVLERLDGPLSRLVLKTIAVHNRAALEEDEDDRFLFFARLLRDADKLDIWRVASDYYRKMGTGEKNDTIGLDLPDTPGISAEVAQNLILGKPVLYETMKNLNDFKLLQAGWIYDINFIPTLRRLQERRYLQLLQQALPSSEEIREIFSTIECRMIRVLNGEAKAVNHR